MPADVGRATACAGLKSRWRDSYDRRGRRAKAPPQAEACPTWTGGPTLARKCDVIPAPARTGFGNLFILDANHLIAAIGTAGETACPPLLYASEAFWRLPLNEPPCCA